MKTQSTHFGLYRRMKQFFLLITINAIALSLVACDNATDPDGAKSLYDQGREYTQWFYQGDTDLLWERSSEQLKLRMGYDTAYLALYRQEILGTIGTETGVVDEHGLFIDGLRIYQRMLLMAGVGVSWMNEDYAQAYYGVKYPTSKLDSFSPESGLHDVHGTLGLIYIVTPKLMLTLTGQGSQLLGDAADSPLTEQAFQPNVSVGVSYNF